MNLLWLIIGNEVVSDGVLVEIRSGGWSCLATREVRRPTDSTHPHIAVESDE